MQFAATFGYLHKIASYTFNSIVIYAWRQLIERPPTTNSDNPFIPLSVMAKTGKNISKAIQILESGGLVAIPTETVYGLAANAFNPDAVARIFEVKNRPWFDPLIVHCSGLAETEHIVKEIPKLARSLAEKFWPGPLTMLMNKQDNISDLVTAGMQKVAIRVPDHPLTRTLLKSLDFPLVAPSANPFGYVSPTTAQHVNQQLGDHIDYILDGGECHIGIESTIVGFDNDTTVVYRLGGLEPESIESITGKIVLRPHSASNPIAPGMLESHYAPGKRIILGNVDELLKKHDADKTGIIRFKPQADNKTSGKEMYLSVTGDLREAAKNLFSVLRKMDTMDVEVILAEKVPEEGLGMAINDRLKRAAGKRM